MKSITEKEYMKASWELKELIDKLGLRVTKPTRKRTKKSRPSAPPEYKLRVKLTCSLCGSRQTKYFLMHNQDNKNYLHGMEMLSCKEYDKTTEDCLLTCKNCQASLTKLSKNELACKYIALYRQTINR